MILANKSRRLAAIMGAVAMLAIAQPAAAQDIPESHVSAARAAISAMRTTDEFDTILPQTALAVKNELIQQNPNLQAEINTVVDETAISLAARRGDLEREIALIYARIFSEPELNEMAAFYATPTGKKVMDNAPIALREIRQAADIWGRGIARDMAQQVGQELEERVGIERVTEPGAEGAPVGEGAAEQ